MAANHYHLSMAAHARAATMSVKSTIESQLRRIAVEHGRTLEPLTDELKLLESGLDSLSFAIVIMRLADSLGVDPFNSGKAIDSPVTLGDLIRMYETFLPEPIG
jgi:acyl carrier protein